MNSEDKKNLIKIAIERGQYKKVLYKYRDIDSAKKILGNSSFLFSNPKSFNDPFDCSLSENRNPSLDDAKKHLQRLGVTGDVLDRSIDLFKRKPKELTDLIERVRENTIGSKGVFCLSENCDNILMWSHYADYHKGLVFGLELESDLDFFIHPIKIEYRDCYEELNYLASPERSTIDTLKVKSSLWSYEREMRIYKDKDGFYEIKKQAFKEIYFGLRTSADDIRIVKEMCEKNGFDRVDFFKAERIHGEFKIGFVKL